MSEYRSILTLQIYRYLIIMTKITVIRMQGDNNKSPNKIHYIIRSIPNVEFMPIYYKALVNINPILPMPNL
jgi:hypothetical protein